MKCLSVVFFVLTFVQGLKGANYEFVFDDPDIFRDCTKVPDNTLNFDGIFNASERILYMKDNDIVNLGGNISISSMWEVEPTDRAEVHIAAYHWEVADWQPTIYNMIIPDLCQAVQDPKNYWYIYFGQYIINKDELKEKCFNVIGTKYYLEAYDVRFNISSNGLPFNGRYKVEFKIDVYGNDYTKRPISACFMATGHFLKK